MKLSFYIARRYLFSKKSSNAINIITWVSICGIGIGTAALIIVLSVFNGLTGFIEGLFSAIDPDIKIEAARGQVFEDTDSLRQILETNSNIAAYTTSLESKVWLEFVDNQTFGTLKGVDTNFLTVNRLDTFVYEGEYDFSQRSGITQAAFGSLVAANLKASMLNEVQPISVFYIPQSSNLTNPQTAFNTDFLFPSGFFSVQLEYDEKYIVTNLDFVRELLEMETEISAYEIRLKNIDQAELARGQLQDAFGPRYKVLTWYEQHSTLYRVMKNEKYISYLILVLMLAIASVNIVGSLSMIVLEKTRDIAVLKSMGATLALNRRIYLLEGVLVGGLGGGLGATLAFIAGTLQEKFGFIKLQGGDSFRVKAFPIELQLNDFVLVFLTVLLLAMLASVYPAIQAAKIKVVEGLRQ
ncbi:MAG: FtsX-like permease family protein [Bacteroidota bacterium]